MGEILEASIAAVMKPGVALSWPTAAKPCDICKSAAALLFCRHDSAFFCIACDSKIHEKLTSMHEKVWMCVVCEQAPACVSCKVDAATLCVTCDFVIHSANPLSRRHERTPVIPFFDMAEFVFKSSASALLLPIPESDHTKTEPSCGNEDLAMNVTDSWGSSDPISSVTCSNERSDLKSIEFLLSESDHLMQFDYQILMDNQFNSGSDSVVPVQNMSLAIPSHQLSDHSPENHFKIDFTRSCINSYNNKNNFTAPSLSHSVSSSSSIEVGMVPDECSISEASYSYGRSLSSSVDLNGSGGGYQCSNFPGTDREARVLRYREKRKNRRFQKTIRYATRKTYAETRPRIKGRFAKRTEVDD